MDMIKATHQDKELVLSILRNSFRNEKSIHYIIWQDHKAEERYRAVIEYSYEVALMFGEVYLSDDRQACALLLYKYAMRTTLKSIWWDLKLIHTAVSYRGVIKLLKWIRMIDKIMPNKPLLYLWFIGVNPSYQHQGIGSQFLAQVLEKAEREKLPVYLENSTQQNNSWYKRFGFEVYAKIDLGYDLLFFKRDVMNK